MHKNTYTVKEVAKLLDFSTNTVYKHLDEGTIKSVRIGPEGRFRIPASEVERLLQEKGLPADQTGSAINHIHTVSPIEPFIEEKIHNVPSLFDWFVATMSICLGFSLIVFKNTSLAVQVAMDFSPITMPLQIILLLGGIVLIVLDMRGRKESLLRKIINMIVSIDYLLMGMIFFSIGKAPFSAGYISIGVVIIFSTFIVWSQQSRYLFLTCLLGLLIGIGYFVHSESFLLPKSISIFQNSILGIVTAWAIVIILTIVFSILAIKKNKNYIWFVVVPSVIMAIFYAIISFSAGYWTRTIFCVVFASYSIIFPFANDFESFTVKSKKDLVLSFVWLVGLIMVGSLMLFFVYHSFQDYALSELEKRVDTASDVVTSYLDGNVAKISTFASDYELIESLKKIPEEESLAEYNLRQLYQSGNRGIARAILVNDSGIIIDTYPFLKASQGVDISGRDYFMAVKNGSKVYISGITKPSTPNINPAVLISLPVLDTDGKFLGALIGSVDLTELDRRVDQVRFSESGTYLLVDDRGNYVIPPTPDKILTKAPEGSLIASTLSGKSGAEQSLDSNGGIALVAYREVDNYGWGILAEQPYAEVFNPYSQTAFIIFFVLILAGVGSLVIVFSIKNESREGENNK